MTTIFAKDALLPDGWAQGVCITIGADGRIADVRTGQADNAQAHDAVLPAPVNLHSHSFQRAMAGLTEMRGPDPRDSFWTWRQLMYRFLDRLTPDQTEAIAAQVFMEMAEAGYAAVAEFHYLHHGVGGQPYDRLSELSDRIIAAAHHVGLGLTHLPVLYQFGGLDRRALTGGQQRFGNDPDQFARLWSDARDALTRPDDHIGVAPHSLRAVDGPGMAAALTLGASGPVHLHLAEQIAEVDEVQTHTGARPVEHLLATQNVGPDWCLIHCTQMTDAETRALAKTGAVAGLCPITESSLGDGVFNGTGFLQAGGRIGFGSDSNVHISLFDELKTLEYSQRLRDRSRAVLATQDRSTGRVLFDQAAQSGAQAAGRNSGAIAPGQWADLICVTTDNAHACGRRGDTLLDTLIFGGHGQKCLTDVWSAGRHIVTDGAHPNRRAITRRFMTTLQELGQEI